MNIRRMTQGSSFVSKTPPPLRGEFLKLGLLTLKVVIRPMDGFSKFTAIGWTVSLSFEIGLNVRDVATLKAIQDFFNGIGHINISGSTAKYRVRSGTELQVLIDHFTNYPLCTSKSINFAIFVYVFGLIGEKAHLNPVGFLNIVALANKINKPLSDRFVNKSRRPWSFTNYNFQSPGSQ